MAERKGLVMVNTGDGKGKTTAALGLAVRAACAGLRVFIGQFMKGLPYAEQKLPGRFPGLIEMEQFGTPRMICQGEDLTPEDLRCAREGLDRIREVLAGGGYDVVVADEMNIALSFGLLREEAVLDLLRNRPAGAELVLTGRAAPASVLELADLVTEMREVRHYYATEGLKARKGIEF